MTRADAASGGLRWRMPADGGVQWRRWDDEVALRVDATGDTHLLAEDASLVFCAVAAHAADGASTRAIAEALVADADAADIAAVQRLLAALHALRAIDRIDP